MTTDLLLPVAVLTAIVMSAFVVGRVRVGDWVTRRDLPVVAAVVAIGVIAYGVTLAPAPVALLGLPITVSSLGAYLALRERRPNQPAEYRGAQLARLGAAAAVVGLIALTLGLVRLLVVKQ